jgi:hypothetical protein
MIDDLTMLSNQPVLDTEVTSKAKAEADKAAAGETMPAPKRKRSAKSGDSRAARVARRGQDPPEQEKAAAEDS